jgi:hypothetical protein
VQLEVEFLALFGRVGNGDFKVVAKLPGPAAQPVVPLHPLADGKIRQAGDIRLGHGADLLDERLGLPIDRNVRVVGHQRHGALGAGGDGLPALISPPQGAFDLGGAQKAHFAPEGFGHLKGNPPLVNIGSNIVHFAVAQVGFPDAPLDLGGPQRRLHGRESLGGNGFGRLRFANPGQDGGRRQTHRKGQADAQPSQPQDAGQGRSPDAPAGLMTRCKIRFPHRLTHLTQTCTTCAPRARKLYIHGFFLKLKCFGTGGSGIECRDV